MDKFAELRSHIAAFSGVTLAKAEFSHYRFPHEPTPAQIEAGNYPKRKVAWRGLTISIENEAGSVRRGVDRDGHEWETRMVFPYGYILGSRGSDSEHVDCYLGPDEDAPTVYVVHQRKAGAWDQYDEDKAMLGFRSRDEAIRAYLLHYDDPRFLGPVTAMPVDEFKDKVLAADGRMVKSLGHAKAGGEVGVNGFHYKGGQFLPTTDAEPGKWKVGKKWVTSGKELIAPGEFAVQPTPFSVSLFRIAGVGFMTILGEDGNLSLNQGANGGGVRDYSGKPITLDTEITPGVKGVLGKQSLTLGEIIDAWNTGQRWFDVMPDAPVLTTLTKAVDFGNKTRLESRIRRDGVMQRYRVNIDAGNPVHGGGSRIVATVSGDELADLISEFAGDKHPIQKAAAFWYQRNLQGHSVRNHALLAPIRSSKKGRDEFTSFGVDEDKMLLVVALRAIVEHGDYIRRENIDHPRRDGIVAFHIVDADVVIAGRRKRVRVEVGEDPFGALFYDLFGDALAHDGMKKAAVVSLEPKSKVHGGPGSVSLALDSIILDTDRKSNLDFGQPRLLSKAVDKKDRLTGDLFNTHVEHIVRKDGHVQTYHVSNGSAEHGANYVGSQLAEQLKRADEAIARYGYLPSPAQGSNGRPKKSKLSRHQWAQVRTPSFIRWFGNWKFHEEARVNVISVEKLPGGVNASKSDSVREWLLTSADFSAPAFNEDAGVSIEFSRKNLRASLKRRGESHRQAYTVLRDIIGSARYLEFEASDRDTLVGQDVYVGAMEMDGKLFSVRIKVDVRHDRSSAYKDHKPVAIGNIADIEVTPAVSQGGRNSALDHPDTTGPARSGVTVSMGHLVGGIKPKHSKVLDENGEPLVVYHGTNADFQEFLPNTDRKTIHPSGGAGFFFTPSRKYAGSYSDYYGNTDGGNVMPVFLSLKNPAVFTYQKFMELTHAKHGFDAGEKLRSSLMQNGHDGIIVKSDDGDDEVVAFHGHQVKSAIGNRGTFDAATGDMTKANMDFGQWLLKSEHGPIPAGAHWITVRPGGTGKGQPILVMPQSDGSMRVIGGAGGALNHLKLRSVKQGQSLKDAARQRQQERQEARKKQIEADKAAGIHEQKAGHERRAQGIHEGPAPGVRQNRSGPDGLGSGVFGIRRGQALGPVAGGAGESPQGAREGHLQARPGGGRGQPEEAA